MSFQSAQRARTRRRTITFAIAAVVAIAAFFVLRGRGDDPEPPRILGTVGDTTGFYEEIGVFEPDTSGDVVTITEEMVGDTPAAPSPPRPAPAATREPARAPAEAPAQQATANQQSRNALAMNNSAWRLHLAGKYEEAEDQLREVIRIAPGRAIAYANLGETLWKLGRNDEAAAMYRKFLELNTDPRRERIAEGKIAQITGS